MSISPAAWSTFVNFNEAPLPEHEKAYFRARLKNRVHEVVLMYFLEQVKGSNLTKAELARRLGKEPSQLTRWLAAPGNWTLDTVSDLLLAMSAEPVLSVMPFSEIRPANESHEIAESPQYTFWTDQQPMDRLSIPAGVITWKARNSEYTE